MTDKHSDRLSNLRKILLKEEVDIFILPSHDEFLGEYVPDHLNRLKWLTHFSGSYGVCLIGKNFCYFLTDGRYALQAKAELNLEEYNVFIAPEQTLSSLIDKAIEKVVREETEENKIINIAVDPFLHSFAEIKKIENIVNSYNATITLATPNFIDKIWILKDKLDINYAYHHPVKYTGLTSKEKLDNLYNQISKYNADIMVITDPHAICWLLNIRARDVLYTPILHCYLVIDLTDNHYNIDLITDLSKITQEFRNHLLYNIKLIDIKNINSYFENKITDVTKALISEQSNYWFFYKLMLDDIEIIPMNDIISQQKSRKNPVEIDGAIKGGELDAIALIKFLYWLDQKIIFNEVEQIDEIKASDRLLEFRQESEDFLYPSFATISGFASNGAIIHYHSTLETNKQFHKNNLYLVDSGGQYPYATTDITRTIAIGEPSLEQQHNYTRVLKGHIALAHIIFPMGTNGSQLDILARQYLWQACLDYEHGTGHGVGSYLSVHEGPQRISKYPNNIVLEEGMILSNEPGYYKKDNYGIRLENLMLVEKYLSDEIKNHNVVTIHELEQNRKYLKFKTLSLVPFDENLIDLSMLEKKELLWLIDYYTQIIDMLTRHKISEDIIRWVVEKRNKFNSISHLQI